MLREFSWAKPRGCLKRRPVVAAAFAGLGLVGAAASALTVRTLTLVGGFRHIRQTVAWAVPDLSGVSKAEIVRLLHPAVAVMAIPLGFALNLQGATLVVASGLGLTAVAAFNSTRTLSRLVYQAVGVVNHAIMPRDFARAGRS